jgi:hypothetical protein
MRIRTIAKASCIGVQPTERSTRILKVKSGVKAGKVTMQDFHFTS